MRPYEVHAYRTPVEPRPICEGLHSCVNASTPLPLMSCATVPESAHAKISRAVRILEQSRQIPKCLQESKQHKRSGTVEEVQWPPTEVAEFADPGYARPGSAGSTECTRRHHRHRAAGPASSSCNIQRATDPTESDGLLSAAFPRILSGITNSGVRSIQVPLLKEVRYVRARIGSPGGTT